MTTNQATMRMTFLIRSSLVLLLLTGTPRVLSAEDADASLLQGAAKGDLATVQTSLEKGAKVDIEDDKGRTPLIFASRNGYTNIVELLLAKGANVHVKTKMGYEALVYATESGYVKIVELLLLKGADVNVNAGKRWTALGIATQKGDAEMVKLLLEKGADVNAWNIVGVDLHDQLIRLTPLDLAKENARVEVAELLKKAGGKIFFEKLRSEEEAIQRKRLGIQEDAKQDGWPPLMTAACNGELQKVRSLIAQGDNLEATNWLGCTVLMEVAKRPRPEVLKLLVEKGANVDAKGKGGHTALMCAVFNNQPENVKILIEADAELELRNEYKDYVNEYDALELAQRDGRTNIVEIINKSRQSGKITRKTLSKQLMNETMARCQYEAISNLIARGANANYTNSAYFAVPLQKAVEKGKADVVKLLLDHGANPNFTPPRGFGLSPIEQAANSGNAQIVRLLLNKNAQWDDLPGKLVNAAKSGHADMVRLLIELKVDLNATDKNGRTAIWYAASEMHGDVVSLLEKAGAKRKEVNADDLSDVLLDATGKCDVEKVQALIQKGASVNAPGSDGVTPLLKALKVTFNKRKEEMVEFLIKSGANVDARDNNGIELVPASCGYGHEKDARLVKLLIEKGANPNATDELGRSALMVAATFKCTETVKVLLQNKAKVNVKGPGDTTPLMVAAAYGTKEIVELLLENGAEINAANKSGMTPLLCAVESHPMYSGDDTDKLVELLIKKGANVKAKTDAGQTALMFAQTRGERHKKVMEAVVELLKKAGAQE